MLRRVVDGSCLYDLDSKERTDRECKLRSAAAAFVLLYQIEQELFQSLAAFSKFKEML
jgi:hypothetical protein